MRLFYLFLLAAMLTQTACDHPIMGLLDRARHDEDQDRQRLRRMRAEIADLVGEANCESVEDCRYIGLGAKPCGGPWEYLVFSTVDTDVERLQEKVRAYNDFERRMNLRYGYISDCALAAEPQLDRVEGRCVDLNRPEGISVEPPDPGLDEPQPVAASLSFAESLEEVAPGDDFALGEVAVEGDLLRVTVSYSGGCAEHEFALWTTRSAAEGAPPRHVLRLTHAGNGDMCEAYITQELYFNLNAFRRLHPDARGVVLALEGMEEELRYAF